MSKTPGRPPLSNYDLNSIESRKLAWEMRVYPTLVKADSGCFNLSANRYHKGVVSISLNGKVKNLQIQRIALEVKLKRPLLREERPVSICGNPKCNNPDHLELELKKHLPSIKLDRYGDRPVFSLTTKSYTGRSWSNLMNRCYNPNVLCFPEYGGRGIIACEGIRRGPQTLVDCIGVRPKKCSIDRICSSDGYLCGKCNECSANEWKPNIRWASDKEQRRNQSRNIFVDIRGERLCLMEVTEKYGFRFPTIYGRYQNGLRGEELIAPKKDPAKIVEINGITATSSEWCRRYGIKKMAFLARLRKGKTGAQLLEGYSPI